MQPPAWCGPCSQVHAPCKWPFECSQCQRIQSVHCTRVAGAFLRTIVVAAPWVVPCHLQKKWSLVFSLRKQFVEGQLACKPVKHLSFFMIWLQFYRRCVSVYVLLWGSIIACLCHSCKTWVFAQRCLQLKLLKLHQLGLGHIYSGFHLFFCDMITMPEYLCSNVTTWVEGFAHDWFSWWWGSARWSSAVTS